MPENMSKRALSEKIGSKIKELREKKDITQDKLALKATITGSTVSNIERGNPALKVDDAENLFAGLGYQMEIVLTKIPEPVELETIKL